MTKIPKEEKENLSAFMNDLWVLVRKYYVPEAPDSPYWDELVQEIKDIYGKYNQHPFVKAILFGFLDYEDDEMKRRYR